MNEIEAAWLAGLLEGEGCFHVRKENGRPIVKLNMTDRDVVERAASLMGATYSVAPPQGANYKEQYVIFISATEKVRAVLGRIRPYMGERRSRAILAAIGADEPALF